MNTKCVCAFSEIEYTLQSTLMVLPDSLKFSRLLREFGKHQDLLKVIMEDGDQGRGTGRDQGQREKGVKGGRATITQ